MGRRKNNPDLVNELIEGLWKMDDSEFNDKFNSLSRSDMSEVAETINGMEDEYYSDIEDDPDFDLANFCHGGDLLDD